MEHYKLKIFKEENPSTMLSFINLSSVDIEWVLKRLSDLLRLSQTEYQSIFDEVLNSLKNEFIKTDIDNVYMRGFLEEGCIIESDSICFVIWDKNHVDLFKRDELIKNWEYLWFDASDEAIILYFPIQEKVILLTDQGFIKTN